MKKSGNESKQQQTNDYFSTNVKLLQININKKRPLFYGLSERMRQVNWTY